LQETQEAKSSHDDADVELRAALAASLLTAAPKSRALTIASVAPTRTKRSEPSKGDERSVVFVDKAFPKGVAVELGPQQRKAKTAEIPSFSRKADALIGSTPSFARAATSAASAIEKDVKDLVGIVAPAAGKATGHRDSVKERLRSRDLSVSGALPELEARLIQAIAEERGVQMLPPLPPLPELLKKFVLESKNMSNDLTLLVSGSKVDLIARLRVHYGVARPDERDQKIGEDID